MNLTHSMQSRKSLIKLPFVKNYALQSYLPCEDGLQDAYSKGVDTWYVDGSLHTDMVNLWTNARIVQLQDKMDAYKMNAVFHSNFKVPICSDVPELRIASVNYIKQEIDICEKLNSPLIIHGGAIVEPRKMRYAKKLALESLLHSLEELKDYADKKKVNLWIENLSHYPKYHPFSYIFCLPEEFEFILNRLDISLFYDFGHGNINATENVLNIFKKFYKRISGISLSNNNGLIDQHLSLSKGLIDYYKVVKLLIDLKWSGLVGFETRDSFPEKNIEFLTKLYQESLLDHH